MKALMTTIIKGSYHLSDNLFKKKIGNPLVDRVSKSKLEVKMEIGAACLARFKRPIGD